MTEASEVSTYKSNLSVASLAIGLASPAMAFFFFMAESAGQQPSIVKLGLVFFAGFGVVNAIACIIQIKSRKQLLDLVTAAIWVAALSAVVFAEYSMAQDFHPNNATYRMRYFTERLTNWLPLYFIVGTVVIAGWGLFNNAMAKLTK